MKKFGITLLAIFGLVFISSAQLEDSPKPIKKSLKESRTNITAQYRDDIVVKFKESRKKKFQNAHIEKKAHHKHRVTKPIRHTKMVR